MEKHSFPPDLVVRIGLPEEWAHPRFPSSAVLGELVSLATVPEDGRPRDPPRAMSVNNPFPRGQRAGGSTCPSSAPRPLAVLPPETGASSVPLTLAGDLETSCHEPVFSQKRPSVSSPCECAETGLPEKASLPGSDHKYAGQHLEPI